MNTNRNIVREEEIKKAMIEAFKQIVKDVQSEPALIIETGDTGDKPDIALEDIRRWLFRRR